MEDRITLTEAFSALAGYGPALWCGVAAAIATFIVELIPVSYTHLCLQLLPFSG